jgi:capsular exopolysaccharide synthesis family protein
MSRIDDALARARNFRPEDLAPAGAPAAPAGADFIPEPPPADEGVPGREKPRSTLVREDERTGQALMDTDDMKPLASAEKLMLNPREPASAEQYRRLAARLLLAHAERNTRVVMVTSALPGEGKTLTATNLALTLSESYKRPVLLIDADLRRPGVHQLLELPNVRGLNDGLREADDRKIALLRYTEYLSILTAGRPDADPMSVLSGDRMRRVLEEAAARFEWVIIDTPPVALLTDAHLLAALVDSVVLVVHAGQTPLPAINTAIQAVGRERILGVVLNRVDAVLHPGVSTYYEQYSEARA